MYKFLAILFCIILLFFCSPKSDFVALTQNYQGTMYFNYQLNFSSPTTNTIKNGNGYIISCNSQHASHIKTQLDSKLIQGYAFVSKQNINLHNFLLRLDAKIIYQEKLDNIEFIYAYSPYLKKHIQYNEQKINLQIAVTDCTTTIGYPAILIGV